MSGWRAAAFAWNAAALIVLLLETARLRPPFATSAAPLAPFASELIRATPTRVTDAQRDAFNRDGFIHVPNLLPEPVAMAARAALEREPPHAPPLLRSVASYQLNLAWASYAALKELSFAGHSAAVASQLLATPGVRVVNSIVYGVDVGQSGADWHVDQPSFHIVSNDSPTLSTWLALGTIDEAASGGSLKFVSAARAAAAGCVADAATGRPTGDARRDCVAALETEARSFDELRPGDALIFRRDTWHRTSPLSRGAPLRWSYTERWAAANATLSATDNWLLAFGTQPRCMHGLRPGDRLAGACFPRVASDAAASPEEPPLVGTSLLPRLALTLAHQLAVASGGGGGGGGLTLALWWRLFLWTQAFEVPVYGQLLLASPAGAGEMARALTVGAAASALTHPAACILYVLLLRQRLALAPPAWPFLRSAEGWTHWILVEAVVVAVEARWLRGRARDPWWTSAVANAASCVGGWALARFS
jgi:hypothetical protein